MTMTNNPEMDAALNVKSKTPIAVRYFRETHIQLVGGLVAIGNLNLISSMNSVMMVIQILETDVI